MDFLPAHELGTLSVLGNLWQALKPLKMSLQSLSDVNVCHLFNYDGVIANKVPLHEGFQVGTVVQTFWCHHLVLEERVMS